MRVWPADDYTRVTLENDSDLKATHFVVQIRNGWWSTSRAWNSIPTLKSLVAKIQSNDPYIKQVRVGQNRPNVVRLVFDLKEEIKPQVFTLAPVGDYKHRLIFDLYPVKPVDPIAAMIEKGDWSRDAGRADRRAGAARRAARSDAPTGIRNAGDGGGQAGAAGAQRRRRRRREPQQPKVVRLITIALDPGHGGEDPGAIGAPARAKRTSCWRSPSGSSSSSKSFPTCASC